MANEMNPKGQVALWFLLAIVIFGLIILFFIFRNNVSLVVNPSGEVNPEAFMKRCINDNAEEILEEMFINGGFIEPSNYIMYNDVNITYLCKNVGNYKPCINQHPMFLSEIRLELINNLRGRIDECLSILKEDVESEGRSFSLEEGEFLVDFAYGKVFITLKDKITISGDSVVFEYSDFQESVDFPAYDMAKIAMEIASQEAQYCYFEYVGYQLLYPDIKITKTTRNDATRIYNMEHIRTGKEMNIAIRGCAIPPGI